MAKGIGKELDEKLKNLREYIAIAIVGAKGYQKTNIGIIKHLTEVKKTPGVYVTLNKPFSSVESELKKSGIDTRMIIFIDAVTKTAGGKTEKTDSCLFIGSPENISDISIAMDQAVRAITPKEKFVFFDSLSTLLMYNDAATVARFIHFLAGKMRVWKVKGIIISLKKEKDKELIDELMQFCDVMLEFDNNQ